MNRFRSETPLLRHVFTRGREREFPMLDAAGRDQVIGHCSYQGSFATHDEHLQAVVMIQVHVQGGNNPFFRTMRSSSFNSDLLRETPKRAT